MNQVQLSSLIISIIILIIVIILMILVCYNLNNTTNTTNNNNNQQMIKHPKAVVALYANKNKFGQTALCHGSGTCTVPSPYNQHGPEQAGDICGRNKYGDATAWCQDAGSRCMTAFNKIRSTIGCQPP